MDSALVLSSTWHTAQAEPPTTTHGWQYPHNGTPHQGASPSDVGKQPQASSAQVPSTTSAHRPNLSAGQLVSGAQPVPTSYMNNSHRKTPHSAMHHSTANEAKPQSTSISSVHELFSKPPLPPKRLEVSNTAHAQQQGTHTTQAQHASPGDAQPWSHVKDALAQNSSHTSQVAGMQGQAATSACPSSASPPRDPTPVKPKQQAWLRSAATPAENQAPTQSKPHTATASLSEQILNKGRSNQHTPIAHFQASAPDPAPLATGCFATDAMETDAQQVRTHVVSEPSGMDAKSAVAQRSMLEDLQNRIIPPAIPHAKQNGTRPDQNQAHIAAPATYQQPPMPAAEYPSHGKPATANRGMLEDDTGQGELTVNCAMVLEFAWTMAVESLFSNYTSVGMLALAAI